jgi:hypothetical protein
MLSIALVVVASTIVEALISWGVHKDAAGRDRDPGARGTVTRVEAQRSSQGLSPPPQEEVEPRGHLSAAAAALRAGSNAEQARKILADLRSFLDSLPKNAAAAAVIDFLNEGADAPTGLEFTLGRGGVLTGATSLRVFLLDYLAAVDPLAAGIYAARILQTATSPDEWAIGMRNYARAYPTPEGTAFLRSKTEEMIQNAAWLANPSGGFLEAFDVFVHTNDTAATPLLGKLVRDQNQRGAGYAAYLTLDRLVIAQPQVLFFQIEQQPDLFKGRELMKSNFLARANVRDANQRSQVERYLLDDARTPAELDAFASIYPNSNYMISNNLLTSTETPTRAELAARDQAALQVTDEWLADPRFQRILPQLQAIRRRLQTFVPPANESSHN